MFDVFELELLDGLLLLPDVELVLGVFEVLLDWLVPRLFEVELRRLVVFLRVPLFAGALLPVDFAVLVFFFAAVEAPLEVVRFAVLRFALVPDLALLLALAVDARFFVVVFFAVVKLPVALAAAVSALAWPVAAALLALRFAAVLAALVFWLTLRFACVLRVLAVFLACVFVVLASALV
ncbi:hypothetical protein SADO_15319 [Salinisphaera dokdonensis CL-ES53]|uniref:Uncharacterized protein n=1 Tax=Salinisphaera dokdonensis CL-ES53 TaxID=1304272 RepID=A0ABV2B445_9GAMM